MVKKNEKSEETTWLSLSDMMTVLMVLFMILASLPFVLYLKAIRGKPKDLIGDQQVQGFFKILVVSILIVVFYLFLTSNFTFTEILRYSLFNVTSILTGTGFTSTNYNDWGTPIILLFLFMRLFLLIRSFQLHALFPYYEEGFFLNYK